MFARALGTEFRKLRRSMVTWGTLVPFAAGFDDAWEIDW